MPKPPPSGPHSDIGGVHQDGVSNVERTLAAAQDPADMKITRAYGKAHGSDVDESDEEAALS